MGGDHAPDAIVTGAIAAARSGIPVVLVGQERVVRPLIHNVPNLGLIHAPQQIGMEDKPVEAIRRKSGASMRRVLELVKDNVACAAVSCGNSGAFVVGSILELRPIAGLERPAIATVLPRSDGGRLVLLDSGANVDCRPELLSGFAALGVALAEVLGVERPRVGVLSNGSEDTKGNAQVQAALALIRATPLNVVGPMEPQVALAGGCDVLVCDGFMGNVLIKSAEGAVETVLSLMRDEIRRSPSARVGTLLLSGALKRFRQKVAWDAHGGGLLLGVNGVVVVGHGRANPAAVEASIRLAWMVSRERLVSRVQERFQKRCD
jgi:glycerol-3-phosphate acyltransferase PlsX